MRFTLILGAPVHANNSQLGTLKRIIVNNGIANQITVHPGFLGIERVVPINVFRQAETDTLELDISDDDWKSFPAYTMNQGLETLNDASPDLSVLTPSPTLHQLAPDTSHPLTTEPVVERTTVDQLSVVLSSSTAVVDESTPGTEHTLRGITIDTGRPQELLLADGSAIPFTAVTMLDEDRIHIGGRHQQPVLDADRGYKETRPHDPAGDQRR